jgi:uncharacterized repeat protein (TIGR01451 family)
MGRVTNKSPNYTNFNVTNGNAGTFTFKLSYAQLYQKDLNANGNMVTNLQLNGIGGGMTNFDPKCVVAMKLLPPPDGEYTVRKAAFKLNGTDAVGVVKPGDKFKYVIEVSNPSTTARTGITVVDTFDAAFASKFILDNPVPAGAVISGNTITWTGVNVPAGTPENPGITKLTFDATVKPDFFNGGSTCSQTVSNTVKSTTPVNTPPYVINVTVSSNQCGEVTIVKDVNPGVASPGATVTYTSKVTNIGTVAQPIVRIVDDYPDSFSYIDDSATFVRPDGSTFKKDPLVENGRMIWVFSPVEQVTLQPSQMMTFTYQMRAANQTGQYPNTICLEVPDGGCDDAIVVIQQLCKAGDAGCGIETKDIVIYTGLGLISLAVLIFIGISRRRNGLSINTHSYSSAIERPRVKMKSKPESFDDKLDSIVSNLKKKK